MKEVKSPKKAVGLLLRHCTSGSAGVQPDCFPAAFADAGERNRLWNFMKMIEDQQIGEVQVEDNQILFTDKDEQKVYKTGVMDDPNLTERLYKSGAKFSKDIDQTTSPLMNFLITVVLPLVIFIGLGQYMSKKLLEQARWKKFHDVRHGKKQCKSVCPVFGWHPFQ